MRTRPLIALAVLTAITVLAAGWSVAVRSRATLPEANGGPLFPGLSARVNDVARLELAGQGSRVTIVRTADGWAVEQKDGHRADPGMVKALVLALAEARALEPRTALPDLYPRIGVEDPGTAGAASTGVTLSAADGRPLAALVAGKSAGTGTLYARRAGEGPSWLVKADLGTIETDPLRWIAHDLPQVSPDAVASIEIRQPDGRVSNIRRDAPGQPFTGAESSVVEEIVAAAALFIPQDAAREDPALFRDAVTTTIRRFDGSALTVRTAWRDGQAWVAFDAVPGWQYRVFDAVGRALTGDVTATEGKS